MMRGVGPMAKLAGGGRSGNPSKSSKGNRKKVKGGRITPSSKGLGPSPLDRHHHERRKKPRDRQAPPHAHGQEEAAHLPRRRGRQPFARDGRFIEAVGTYEPRMEPSTVEIDNARALGWLAKGAQPTETVRKLLVISGAWEQFESGRPPSRSPAPRPARPAGRRPRQEGPREEGAGQEGRGSEGGTATQGPAGDAGSGEAESES